MLKRLEGYIRKKRLVVNEDKTKIIRFQKRGSKKRAIKW